MNEDMKLEDIVKYIEIANKVLKTAIEEVNWLYRKSNGLLYYYKHRPSVIKTSLPFSLVNAASYDVIPVKGDKATLLPEKDNNLSYIPKNVLIHRDDLFKYKAEE